jgi:hypothetical protein
MGACLHMLEVGGGRAEGRGRGRDGKRHVWYENWGNLN